MKTFGFLKGIMLGFVLILLTSAIADENWYICNNCCKTKKGTSAPWESGCRASGSQHNYSFVGKAGDFNYICRKCDAEVYLKSGQSPAASKCCSEGSTHTWYHK